MPKVADLPGRIRICQYHRDHDPPHFHVERAGQNALVRIADLEVERGAVSAADLAVVRAWAREHQAELALNWVLARAGMDLRDIPFP